MADYTYMTEGISDNYSSFSIDNNLTPDSFVVLEDLPASQIANVTRLNTLKAKTALTSDEQTEYDTLLSALLPYMPTSDILNKYVAGVYKVQVFLRDEIVYFIEDKQAEFNDILANFSYKGEYISTTLYIVGNQVTYNGLGFTCIQANTGVLPSVESDTEYWVRYTVKGEQGDPSLNIYCRGVYDETVTYNLSNGDACIYDHVLYYALEDGIVGISPIDDNTKWACADKIIISNNPPSDTSRLWLDISLTDDNISGVIKRYIRGIGWKTTGIDLTEITTTIDTHISNNTIHTPYLITSGGANAYTATLSGYTVYTRGDSFRIEINATNTGSSTLNINSLGARQILDSLGNSVMSGSLKTGIPYTVCFNGLNFILQGKGGGGNLTPEVLLSGYNGTGDIGNVVGTMANNGAVNATLGINGTYTITKGYHNGQGKITQNITTKSAQTYTPSTVNQVIGSGRYLTGNQTILGDADLISANIVSGKSIFNVVGSATIASLGGRRYATGTITPSYDSDGYGNSFYADIPTLSFIPRVIIVYGSFTATLNSSFSGATTTVTQKASSFYLSNIGYNFFRGTSDTYDYFGGVTTSPTLTRLKIAQVNQYARGAIGTVTWYAYE